MILLILRRGAVLDKLRRADAAAQTWRLLERNAGLIMTGV
jgi:hypothetical protein